MKTFISRSLGALFLSIFVTSGAFAQIATGGPYTMEQSAVASGGGSSTAGVYMIEGTVGQPAVGTGTTGTGYFLRGGFWTPAPFGPTAANVSLSGRVIVGHGIGIKNAQVVLSGGKLSSPMVATTNQLGLFVFEEVEVGQTYVLSVFSKRFTFAEPVKFMTIFESLTDINFQAE